MIEHTHTNNPDTRYEGQRRAKQRAQRRMSGPTVSEWTPDQESVKKMEKSVVAYMNVATKNMQSRHRDMNTRPSYTLNTIIENAKPSRRSSMSLISNNEHERQCTGMNRNLLIPNYPELRKEAYVHASMDDYFLNKNVREMNEHDNKCRKGTGKRVSRQMSDPTLSQERRYEMSAEDPETSKVDRLLLATKDAFDKFMDGFTEEQEEEILEDVSTSDGKLLQSTKDMLDKFIGGFAVEHNMSENVASHVANWTKFQGFRRQNSVTAKMFQRLAVR